MNRRKSKRLTRRLRVTVISQKRTFQSYTGNLSAGGIIVRSLKQLPDNTQVMIILELPSGEELHLYGKVTWAFSIPVHGFRKNGIGIEFTQRSARYDEFIKSLYSEVPDDLAVSASG
ncbi:MAG: PilZ domain-containing protein [Promethearchaeota archaeon]|jgi:Tfp pilus assembly protein PilZ